MEKMKDLAIERHNNAKRFIGIFEVQNGESQYEIIVKTEAETLEEAKDFFNNYITPDKEIGYPDAWQLRDVFEVKTFEELWNLVRG